MQVQKKLLIGNFVALMCLVTALLLVGTASKTLAADKPASKTGIIWRVPASVKPNIELSHPRVTYTVEQLKQAKAKLANNTMWAKVVYENIKKQADTFSFTADQIRLYMPAQYSYFKYTDAMVPCPDGSPMTADWSRPGKVTCGRNVYPDATHPDDGRGWRDATGTTHYFVARWNGYVVEQLTNSLMPMALAYALGGDEKYANNVATILDAIATIYPTATEGPLDYPGLRPGLEGGRLERPYYQTARVLFTYTNAADLIWNSKALDAKSVTNPALSVRDNIIFNMLLNGADFCYREANRTGFVNSLSNGTADYNKAILAVGSMLGIDQYVEWAVNGPTSLQTMITNNIDRDGMYYENTSFYTDVVRELYLQSANIFYNLRTSKYPQGLNYYNDPRLVALYIDARERSFVAGRIPSYGDSNSDTAAAVKKPIDETAAKQILQFAVRNDDPQARARYWELVAEGMSGFTIVSAQNEWGLFNVNGVPAGVQAPTGNLPGNEVLGEKGMSILRSGDDRGAFLRYGATLTHGQADELGLLLYTQGREMTFDPGYANAHYRYGWTHQSVSHLTTVVNETSQQGSGGSLNFITSTPGFGVTEAFDEGAYAPQGVSVYRRLVSLIDSTPDQSYAVDIFRVKGGKTRDYSFHSYSNVNFSTEGLPLGQAQPGSVASPNYTWHDKIGVDFEIIPYRNENFYFTGPPGNGYGFLGNPRKGTTDAVWNATWDNGDRRLKLFMLPATGREMVVADAPSPMGATKYLLARDKGNATSQFVSVIDMTKDKFQIAAVKELPVTKSNPGDFTPVAFTVTLTNQASQVSDVILSSVTGAFQAQLAGTSYETDAEFASVRLKESAVESMHLSKGSFLNAGDMQLAGVPIAYTGSIVAVDYKDGSILVSAPNRLPTSIAGMHVLVTAPEYSHSSPYQISRAVQEGAYTRLYLFPGSFELAKGSLPEAPQGKRLPNIAPLAYTKVVSRVTPNDYYRGKTVTNDTGSVAQIERVEGDSVVYVNNPAGFAKDDNLTIYDIKVGDNISIPVSVHFTKVDDLTYQFTSPQAAWLALPNQKAPSVIVTDEKGNFVPAKTENRNGITWFEITPGKVVLQDTGRFVGQQSMVVSDDAPAEVKLSLIDLVTQQPISQAVVTTTLDGRTVQFTEGPTGAYSALVPAGIKTGSYNLVVNAAKAGLVFYPHNLQLEVKANWRVQLPEKVEVSIGTPIEIDLAVEGLGAATATVQAADTSQEVTIKPLGNGLYKVVVAPITVEQALKLQVTKAGGFMQETSVYLQPGGGRLVPLENEVHIKAGQTAEIKVKFIAQDGRTLTGENIPYAMAYYGFMTSQPFTDPDGDGIATTKLAKLGVGTQTITLGADGCPFVDITVVVEP